jgi:hypothetical protein
MYITVLITPMKSKNSHMKEPLSCDARELSMHCGESEGSVTTADNGRTRRGFETGSPARRALAGTLRCAALLRRATCSRRSTRSIGVRARAVEVRSGHNPTIATAA